MQRVSNSCTCRVQWRRQYKEFSGTPLGRAAFLGGVFLLFYTGLAFRLLNLLFLLWWIGPLIVLPLLQAASRKVRPCLAAAASSLLCTIASAVVVSHAGSGPTLVDKRGWSSTT